MKSYKMDATDANGVRKLILDAAHKLFAEEGYHSVSMRRIAKLIGYSPTTIYLYFKNKGEVFNCLLDSIFREHLVATERILDQGLDPQATLRALLLDYVAMGVNNPDAYKVGFMRETDLWPQGEDHFVKGSYTDILFQLFLKAVEAVMPESVRDPQAVRQTAWSVWAAAHGVTSLLVTYPSFPWGDVDALINKVVDAAMLGAAS
jgi:AcrR family transcriptional regulator